MKKAHGHDTHNGKCLSCGKLVAAYGKERKIAIQLANTLPLNSLTIEQAAALLPVKPEWKEWQK